LKRSAAALSVAEYNFTGIDTKPNDNVKEAIDRNDMIERLR
jgi:hypothetical protein